MEITQTTLPEVLLLEPKRFGDDRGYFCETWNKRVFNEAVGEDIRFVQDNESYSEQQGTLRGLHFQRPPFAQAKLVRCLSGEIFDVAVDFRVGSPTFGQWFGTVLSAGNGRQLWVPSGFLHGFLTLVPNVQVAYKCTDFYNSQADGSVSWESFGIEWPGAGPFTLSDKDREAPNAGAVTSPFVYEGGEA